MHMNSQQLIDIARSLVGTGKGLLAIETMLSPWIPPNLDIRAIVDQDGSLPIDASLISACHAVTSSAVSAVKAESVAALSTPKTSCRAFCARH